MNALGLHTVQSCGGHLEQKRGLLLPWVDFQTADPSLAGLQAANRQYIAAVQQLHQEVLKCQNEGGDEQHIVQAKQAMHELAAEMQQVQRAIRLLQLEPRKKLAEYLSQFYAHRSVPFDRRLILEGKDTTRLHNQGAIDLYLIAPSAIQHQKLLEYREEMAAFTVFLKQCYRFQQLVHMSQKIGELG
ncbi:MAG: hypothetical protein ACRDHZ_27025, partial [Ktedonobacteraceae bacterium]